MSSAPTITVIIPAYNAQETIVAAISSVLDQSIKPTEIIVIDDGSTDDTARIAASISDLVKVHRVDNGGPSRARNIGLSMANGEYVAFLDDDDLWLEGKIERQVSVLQAHPDIDLVATNWIRDIQTVPSTRAPLTRLSYYPVLVLNRFQTSTVLARTAALRAIDPFDSQLDGVEDWDFWLRLSKGSQMALLEAPLVVYSDNPAGVSKNLVRFYFGMRQMMKREMNEGVLDPKLTRTIAAWHQLRMAVAFLLSHDWQHAKLAVVDLYQDGLVNVAYGAFSRFLVPFLTTRVRRRLNTQKVQGLRYPAAT